MIVTVVDPFKTAKESKKDTTKDNEKDPEEEKRLKIVKEKIENEKYVLLHSNNFRNIFGKAMSDSEVEDLEGLVKIRHNCRTVYRRYKGHNIDGNKILMGSRTMKELRVNEDNYVTVEKASWLGYLWNHQDSCIRQPFRLALFGILLAFISLLFTLLGVLLSTISLMQSIING